MCGLGFHRFSGRAEGPDVGPLESVWALIVESRSNDVPVLYYSASLGPSVSRYFAPGDSFVDFTSIRALVTWCLLMCCERFRMSDARPGAKERISVTYDLPLVD